MEPTSQPLPWTHVFQKIKRKLGRGNDANEARIRRQKAFVGLITRRLTVLKLSLFVAGYLWMLVIPSPRLGRGTYTDENALQPSQVTTYWSWGDVHAADRYLEKLEAIRDSNFTSEKRAELLTAEFSKLGISASSQNYSYMSNTGIFNGTNSFAVLASPRGSGAEAIVISASWMSRTGEGDGTLNLRGVSTVLALAGFLKRYSLWAKDIVFVISDGYLDGMHAWLSSYHGASQASLKADELELSSGVIWTALNIDYPGHSFSHLGVFFEGLNGRLPNQDLLNSFERISRFTGGVPVTVYDHIDPRESPARREELSTLPSWLPSAVKENPEVDAFAYQAKNVLRHVGYQARGRPSGVHGLFHQFRIDAITIFAIPASGPHGFHAIGRIVESTLRTMNNLLERLHASFFFFILTDHDKFIKIGNYLPSAVLIGVAMMLQGLKTWVDAGWRQENSRSDEKDKSLAEISKTKWLKRRRPVIPVLGIMLATHLLGALLFLAITQVFFIENQKILSTVIFLMISGLPLLTLALSRSSREDVAPLSIVLKALNLCCASTVISIITVLNFSLAAVFSIFLGIPLSVSSSSISTPVRLARYAAYIFLGLGWLILAPEETLKAIWNWDILRVWFAPFMCLIYVPLVLQGGIVCLLTPSEAI